MGRLRQTGMWAALWCGLTACSGRALAPGRAGVSPDDPTLRHELVVSGPVAERVAQPDQAELVLFFGGEEEGSLEPCGCEERPRGGLGRVAAYLQAASAAAPQTPSILVNTGGWLEDARGLSGEPLPEAGVRNRWMMHGQRALGTQALNVAVRDAWALSTYGLSADLPLVSANVRGPGVQPAISLDAGVRVAVTGLTAPGPAFLQPETYSLSPPKESRALLEGLRADHDLVVLLSFQAGPDARTLARAGLVDIVIDSQNHVSAFPPARVGDAVWVRSHQGTMRLGELRLRREEGRWVALERKIDLDDSINDVEPFRTFARRARREAALAQRQALGGGVR